MVNTYVIETHLPQKYQLHEATGSPTDVLEYRSIVGAIQYLNLTHPEVVYVVNVLCQFMQSPTTMHWFGI